MIYAWIKVERSIDFKFSPLTYNLSMSREKKAAKYA